MIYKINTEIFENIKSCKNESKQHYVYYGYLTDYMHLISYSFLHFLNFHLLTYESIGKFPIIGKEKRMEILNNLYENIKDNPDLKFEYDKSSPKKDISETFNIFITYLKEYNDHATRQIIDSYLLKETDNNTEYFKPVDDKYRINMEDSISDLKDSIAKATPKKSEEEREKELTAKLKEILFGSNKISDMKFDKYLKDIQEFIEKFGNQERIDYNSSYIYDIKVYLDEIIVNKEIYKKYKHTLSVMEDYLQFLKVKDQDINEQIFKTREYYMFFILKLKRGSYRVSGLLDEYCIFNKILYCLEESLLNAFLNFDYDLILENLHKASGVLIGLLKKEFLDLKLHRFSLSPDEIELLNRFNTY